MGHDVLTTHDVGNANLSIEDESVLKFAIEARRCLITINRREKRRAIVPAPCAPVVR